MTDIAENTRQFADYITLLRQQFTDSESAFLKKTQGMSLQQLKVLLVIASHRPCTMGKVAKHMPMLSLSSITVIVDKLVKQGFVKRARDESDRRVVYADFTTKGKELYQVYEEGVLKLSEEMMSQFSQQEQQEILSVYKKLLATK
jgi:DNA-binding MarR family transcriptional regulator